MERKEKKGRDVRRNGGNESNHSIPYCESLSPGGVDNGLDMGNVGDRESLATCFDAVLELY